MYYSAITKHEFYAYGGFANSKQFRRGGLRGIWRYYSY